MPNYAVNDAAVAHARKLIDAGTCDTETPWSEAAPAAAEGNKEIEREDWDGYAEWHLALDPSAPEHTKKRYAFPYGDFHEVNRAALVHAKQRASQNDHREVEKAAGDLLDRLDTKMGRR